MASMTNKKKTSFKRTEKYQRTGYKFIAPGLLMMVLLIIYPMLYGACVPDNYGTVRSGAGSVDGFYSI